MLTCNVIYDYYLRSSKPDIRVKLGKTTYRYDNLVAVPTVSKYKYKLI